MDERRSEASWEFIFFSSFLFFFRAFTSHFTGFLRVVLVCRSHTARALHCLQESWLKALAQKPRSEKTRMFFSILMVSWAGRSRKKILCSSVSEHLSNLFVSHRVWEWMKSVLIYWFIHTFWLTSDENYESFLPHSPWRAPLPPLPSTARLVWISNWTETFCFYFYYMCG